MKKKKEKKGKKDHSLFWLLYGKWILIAVILVITIIFTCHSLKVQEQSEDIVENLPRITNKEELEGALNGKEQMYAVLHAPVSGSAAQDSFGIIKDDCIYIEYEREEFVMVVLPADDMHNTETTYSWEKKGGQSESFSEDAYIYDDIPIELAGCAVENADVITADRLQLPEGTKAVYASGINYYYPEGMGDNPNAMEENCGLARYKIRVIMPGSSLSFLAKIGEGRITVSLGESEDGTYAAGNLVQNGEISDLSWSFIAGDVGGMSLLWLFLPALIILILIFL